MRALPLLIALLVLASSAEAQRRAPADADQPGTVLPSPPPGPEEPRYADRDPGPRAPRHPGPPFNGSDQDDPSSSLAPAGERADRAEPVWDGRSGASRLAVSRAENPHPDGREAVAAVSSKAPRGVRSWGIDEQGRPLVAPVLDEAAPVSDLPHEEAAKTETPDDALALGASSPNPVERTARIAFTLPEAGTASLVLFDVRGREVATLFEGRAPAGTTAVTLDASSLAAGTYVYVLDVGGERMSRRLQIAR